MTPAPSGTEAQLTAVDFDPFAAGEVLLTAPTTASQKEIWASVQMGDAANCAYNESQSLRLSGPLEVNLLQAALQRLVARHESLRMTFSPDGNHLCIHEVCIHTKPPLEVPVIDLADSSESECQTQLNALIQAEVREPFDLEHGPLFRAKIIRLQPQAYWVLLTAHHIICDGWSWGVLLPELGKLYSALVSGETPDLKPPENFSDYALEEASSPGDDAWAEAQVTEDFWLQQFAQSIPSFDLPTDRPRPALRSFEADREDWSLSASLVAALKQVGARLGCSLMTTMLSAFEVFLYRLTAQTDIVVGVSAAGQAATGNYGLVGHCVNLLPLRASITAELSFNQYLQQRQSQVLDAYEHQRFTFGKLVQKLSIPRDPSRIPLVSVLFNIDQALSGEKLPFAGLEATFFANPRAFENFELFINAVEHAQGMVLECQYNTNLFTCETIQTRLAEFETLLAGIAAQPDTSLATLPLLTATERQLLTQWNQTSTDFPDQCLHQLVEAQVQRTPAAVAVVCEDQQLTYEELDRRANQLAHYLCSLGVKPGVVVGICLQRSLDMVVGLLGVLKAGSTYLPLDPAYPKERLAFQIQDAQVAVVLTQARAQAQLPVGIPVVDLQNWQAITTAPGDPCQPPVTNLTPNCLAYVIYTSGSTGKPKGVKIPHRNVVNLLSALQQQPGLTAADTLISVTTLTFDIAVAEIFLALSVGARLVLASREIAADGSRLMSLMEQVKVTYLQATPATWRLLLAAGWSGSPNLKIVSGGDALTRELANQLLPRCQCLWNVYGPTETTIWSTGYQVQAGDGPITIGTPLANTQTYILDPNQQPVPIGIAGELCIGGVGVAQGYLNRPELTAEKFIANPFSPEPAARLYRTGDLARFLPDGQIEYLGRMDYQVKIRGFRVELGEVETALSEHPAVASCVVVARDNHAGDERLVAYLVNQPGHAGVKANELRKFLKQKLPDFMVPANFVPLEALPLTNNGKIDRKALPEAPAPDLTEAYLAPRTEVEQAIADIWSQVLNLPRVGVGDNFFELGGHSLLAAQLLAQIRRQFAVDLQLRTLFEAPTIAELAERVETIRWLARGVEFATNPGVNGGDYEEGEL